MKYRKFITGILVGCMALANVPLSFAETETLPFSDVTLDSPYFEAITFLKEKGVISGYPDGTFKEKQVVNRAESLKMIYEIEDLKYWDRADGAIFGGAKVDVKFTDINKTAWYFPYLQKAMNDGLVEGYKDGTFKPAQTVNTVENLKILLNHTFLRVDNIEDVEVTTKPYADVPTNEWYSKFVQYGKEKNILTPDSNNKIYPAAGMTRGKLAEVIYKLYLADEAAAGVQVLLDPMAQGFVVMKGDVKMAELPGAYGESDEVEGIVEKVTDKNAYVSICATGLGGYIFYKVCYGNTYRVNLSTGEVKDLKVLSDKTVQLNFMDVAPDELSTAWTSDDKIYILPVSDSDGVVSFDVDPKFTQFGDVKFSPDGKKFAYAAIVGNPTEEYSGVFIVDIATKKETAVVEGLGDPYHVLGWNSNESVEYSQE